MATLCEISDPADPRLADYRDLRDVELRKHLEASHGLFLAEGEKVVRRAVEAGFTARSFLMAPRWLDGLGDVLDTTDAPCFVLSESLVNWKALADLDGTIVLMMAVENAAAIADVLIFGGRDLDTPVAVVCDGTMPGERTVLSKLDDLAADLAAHEVRPPAIIVVGEVVRVAHPRHFS